MRREIHEPSKTLLFKFESCADFADEIQKHSIESNYGSYGSSFAGNESWGESLQRARRGDTSLVEQAEALMDQIVVEAQREQPVWLASVAGAFPCVGDYLAGAPDCMRRRHPTPTDRAPINLYVELTSSGGIPASDMVRRGTAVLALALLLNRERSVTLNVIVGFGRTPFGQEGSFSIIPLGTSPIDIALACNALTSQGFVRNLGYSLMHNHPQSRSAGNWDWDLNPDSAYNRAAFVAKMREAFGGTADDVFIPPSYLGDEAIRDPVSFVKRSLAEALKVDQE